MAKKAQGVNRKKTKKSSQVTGVWLFGGIGGAVTVIVVLVILFGRSGSKDIATSSSPAPGEESVANNTLVRDETTPDKDGFVPMRWPKPGETVYRTTTTDVEVADNLPEDYLLRVHLGDQLNRFTFLPDEMRTLHFDLVLSCERNLSSSNVVGAGFVEVAEVLNSKGERVPARVSLPFYGTEQIKTMDTMGLNVFGTAKEKSNLSFGEIHIQVPGSETEPLQKISGSFVMMTGRKFKQFEIADVPTAMQAPITDPDLVQAGLRFQREEKYGDQLVRVSVNAGYALSDLNVVTEAGYSAGSIEGTSENNQVIEAYSSSKSEGKALPPTFGFKAELWTDLQQTTIPFSFENIAIPAKGEKVE